MRYIYSILLFFFIIQINAQDLQSTTEYISKKLIICGYSFENGNVTFSGKFNSSDYCDFKIKKVHASIEKNKEDIWSQEWSFRFEELDINKIEVKKTGDKYGEFALTIKSKEDKTITSIGGTDSDAKANTINIYSNYVETLNKLKTSFIEAIKLCDENN